MAFMNQAEREALLNQIKDLKVNQIKARLRRASNRVRLAYFRNVQEVGRWMTRYVLEDKGTQVTLVETFDNANGKADFRLVEIIVEPTPENRL